MSTAEAPRVGDAPGGGSAALPSGSQGLRTPTFIAGYAAALRRTVSRIPRAGRVCFLIAFVNAAIWGVLVPPFQVPDEISHFGYAQYFAETGKPPPQGPGAQYSPEEYQTLEGLDFFAVIGRAGQRGILTPTEDHTLRVLLASHLNPLGEGGASSATNQPPLYYALEAIPYWLSPSHDILTRLACMRLLSALIAACTVLAVFLFLRELLPHCAMGVDGRRAGGRLPAHVRLPRRRRARRQPAVPHFHAHVSAAAARLPPRPHDAARRRDRRDRRCRCADQADLHRAATRGSRSRSRCFAGAPCLKAAAVRYECPRWRCSWRSSRWRCTRCSTSPPGTAAA